MAYYTRKPELVEAIQWTGDNLQEIIDFVGNKEKISMAFKSSKFFGGRICYATLEEFDEKEQNIVELYIGPGGFCTLSPRVPYLIKHDYSEKPEMFPFESMDVYRFKAYYQPDSCALDGSGYK